MADLRSFLSRHVVLVMLLLLGGLVLRLGWSFSRPVDAEALRALPDQLEYLQAGRNLLTGNGFWFDDGRFGQRIYASRTAGYPLLIAICRGNVRAVQAVQCALDVSTCLAMYLLARRWLSERRSLVAMALVILNPLLVYHCALILSETLYVAMIAWAVYLVSMPVGIVWGILLAAAAVHVRPSGAPMAAIVGALGALANAPRGKRLVATSAYGLVGLAVTIIALVPWVIRNEQVLGERVWLTTNGGITFYDGLRPGATGASDQSFTRQMPELREMSEVERDEHLMRLSREAVMDDPRRVARLALVKAGRTWSPIPLSQQFSSRLHTLVGMAYAAPLFAAAVAGLIASAIPGRARLLLLGPAIFITLTHAVSVGSMRYRLPAEPMLCVLAAGALSGRKVGSATEAP